MIQLISDAINLVLNNPWTSAAIWLAIGLGASCVLRMTNMDSDFTVNDLPTTIGFAILGPLLIVMMVAVLACFTVEGMWDKFASRYGSVVLFKKREPEILDNPEQERN